MGLTTEEAAQHRTICPRPLDRPCDVQLVGVALPCLLFGTAISQRTAGSAADVDAGFDPMQGYGEYSNCAILLKIRSAQQS